jgi:hypothetical protein
MQRLIEQLADEGDVLVEGHKPLGRVRYHLSVYQHFSGADDEPVPASLKVEGHITPVDDLDLTNFLERKAELTLRLADGQTIDFLITHADGTIRSTGRGLLKSGT